MPYMQFLFCERCGPPSNLDIDHLETIRHYTRDSRNDNFINPATLVWDYLIYTCSMCKYQYKYTYKDVERRVREYFSAKSAQHKEIFDNLIKWHQDDGPIEENPWVKANTPDRIRNRYEYQE